MRNINLMTDLPYDLPPIEDVTDLLPRHKDKSYPLRKPEEIDSIIIHHMASEAPLVNQASYHVNGRGWAGLGYHLVIDTNRLLQTNDLLSMSNHASGWNHRAIGISIRGDLSKRPMTDIERMLLHAAILTVKSMFTITQVIGHNEASKLANKAGTSCPCTDVNRIRQDIIDLEQQIAYRQSEEYMRSQAYTIANNTKFLYNLANGKDQYGNPASTEAQAWAVKMLLKLAPAFKDAGLLK